MLIRVDRYSETQHAKRYGAENALGFTHVLVMLGFWMLDSYFLSAFFGKFPFNPTYGLMSNSR
jgi:hypothetical protein